MEERKWLLLKAIECNWDEIGPGDWTETKWLIFSDGSYEIVATFLPGLNEIGIPARVKRKATGQMGVWAFLKLRKALKCEPWRDPSIEIFASDGVAWEIESYLDDGSIDKTSGKLDYIYGHKALEKIVYLLPSDESIYDSFISVENED